jgi:F-type H+-transporting ATPase subunit a
MTSKKAIGAVVILALALTGFVYGAIGTALTGGDSILSRPEPHIPPQKIFVSYGEDGPAPDQEHKKTEASHENEKTHQDEDLGEGHGNSGVVEEGDGFVLTNTLLSSWIVSLLLISLFYLSTRRMQVVPKGLQNLMEAAIEALYNFVEGVAGTDNAKRFFPLIATIFVFVLANAWIGLLPIYPSLGFMNADGHLVRHLLRPAGTDLNMPLALAIVSFIFVEYWGFRVLGFGYLNKFFPTENIRKRNFSQVPIDLFVGALELLSELIRIVSFTFRLFGNMTAGEILLIMITYLVPFVAILPFYGLEILVGMVQALIFAGLTLVFVVLAVTPHQGEDH